MNCCDKNADVKRYPEGQSLGKAGRTNGGTKIRATKPEYSIQPQGRTDTMEKTNRKRR
jgi:hypothetical protein